MTRSSKLAVVAVCTMFGLGLVLGGFVGPVSEVCAEILHVDDDFTDPAEDTDGDTDFRHIQAAIDAAVDGDEVMVESGTYVENINLSGKSIVLRSTDPEDPDVVEATIIDGNSSGSTVTFDSGEGSETLLSGFTVSNGWHGTWSGGIHCYGSSPTIENCAIKGNVAGQSGGGITCVMNSAPNIRNCIIAENLTQLGGGCGIFCCWSSSPTITGCDIVGNICEGGGHAAISCRESSSPTISECLIKGNLTNNCGGIYCSEYSCPNITHCTITENRSGGLWCDHSSSPNITYCEISSNTGFAGISCFHSSSPTIDNCTISGHSSSYNGGGILCENNCSPIISNCKIINNSSSYAGGGIHCYDSSAIISKCAIIGNSASSGGGIYCIAASSPSVTNCVISNNHAGMGGGIDCLHMSAPTITNCTITNNEATGHGSGIIISVDSEPVIRNSILYNNTPEDENIHHDASSIIHITYSDVQGGYGDPEITHNIDVDPQFIAPSIGDYHLEGTSPCIDAGTTGPGVPPDDIEGNPRDALPDMGAYEYVAGEIQVSIDIKPGSDPNCFNNNGHGVIPVAILGSAEFDVASIDPATVTLEGLAVKAVGKSNKLLAHYEDVNMDSFDDLVVQIEDIDGVFSEGQTTATISGTLYDGTPIQGSDSICIVP